MSLLQQSLEFGEIHISSEALANVCRRYNVRQLSVFGSAARGELDVDSDLDLMVEFAASARVGVVKFESLADELQRLAGRRVDLVTKRGLKPWTRGDILRDARIIYEA